MNRNAQIQIIGIFMAFVVVVAFGVVVMREVGSTAQGMDVTADSTSDTILAANGTTSTLTQTPTTFTSATAKNRTWLEFDGTNDVLTVSDDSFVTISFWYKNATETKWQHILNTSGILYQNGTEVDSITLYPLYSDGSDWFFGKTDGSTFVDVDIDEIRFYNATLNSSEVTSIYENER